VSRNEEMKDPENISGESVSSVKDQSGSDWLGKIGNWL